MKSLTSPYKNDNFYFMYSADCSIKHKAGLTHILSFQSG